MPSRVRSDKRSSTTNSGRGRGQRRRSPPHRRRESTEPQRPQHQHQGPHNQHLQAPHNQHQQAPQNQHQQAPQNQRPSYLLPPFSGQQPMRNAPPHMIRGHPSQVVAHGPTQPQWRDHETQTRESRAARHAARTSRVSRPCQRRRRQPRLQLSNEQITNYLNQLSDEFENFSVSQSDL